MSHRPVPIPDPQSLTLIPSESRGGMVLFPTNDYRGSCGCMAVPVPLRATCAPRPHSCFRPEGTVRCPLGVCGGPAARRHWRGIASLGSPAHRHHLSYRGRHATARSLPPGPTPSFAILFTWGTGSCGRGLPSGLAFSGCCRWRGSSSSCSTALSHDGRARSFEASTRRPTMITPGTSGRGFHGGRRTPRRERPNSTRGAPYFSASVGHSWRQGSWLPC